jgi:hypothetical protein
VTAYFSGFLKKGEKSLERDASPRVNSELVLVAGVAFWTSVYLWCMKPEIWFITLCHATLWPWVGLTWLWLQGQISPTSPTQFAATIGTAASSILLGCTMIFAGVGLAAQVDLVRRMDPGYSWPVYEQWVDCVERTLFHAAHRQDGILKVWQPHVPDILVELSSRHPRWELTRTLDFESLRSRAHEYSKNLDAIVMSRFFNAQDLSQSRMNDYEGIERLEDRHWIENEWDQPFGPWIVGGLEREQPGQWQRHVCRVGPFFADIAVRQVLTRNR